MDIQFTKENVTKLVILYRTGENYPYTEKSEF